MTHRTLDQVLEQRRQLLLSQDTEGFVAVFAPDGAIELPFAGPGMPARLEGRATLTSTGRAWRPSMTANRRWLAPLRPFRI